MKESMQITLLPYFTFTNAHMKKKIGGYLLPIES